MTKMVLLRAIWGANLGFIWAKLAPKPKDPNDPNDPNQALEGHGWANFGATGAMASIYPNTQ